jgi:RHS repeat-associated protein
VTDYLIDPYNHTGFAQVIEEKSATETMFYPIGDDVLGRCKNVGPGRKCLLYDGHGSVRQLTGLAGLVNESYCYDGYGVLLQDDSESLPGTTPEQLSRLLYAGEYFDANAQMYYNRARWYNPLNGRFNRTDPFAGNMQDPQSLHKYLYCHANPINNIDPSGLFSLIGTISAITIGLTVMSLAMPVLGAAYLSMRGDLSFIQVIRHLGSLDTWAAAAGSLIVGAGFAVGINTVISRFAVKLGVTAAKKLVSVVGLLFAITGLVQSARMTWNMVTGQLPAAHAEIYIATMIAGIMLTVLIGKAMQSGRLKSWFSRGSEGDADFWQLTPDEQAAYNRGQGLMPSDVYNELSGMSPVERGQALGANSMKTAWREAQGFWGALRNQFSGSGFSLSDWLATGPTPDMRFSFGQSTEIFSGSIATLQFGSVLNLD